MSSETQPRIPSAIGDPAWEVARFFPPQGQWSESDFFRIHTNQMAELVDGKLEILPMPTWLHQLIVDYLVATIKAYLHLHGNEGVVLFAPLPTRLFPRTIREPDILYVLPAHIPEDPTGYPEQLDLVMEVVSRGADARKRDYLDKRIDYARAGIAEYWIVDPEQAMITVLTLQGGEYQVASENRSGDIAQSLLLAGLLVPIDEVLALGKKSSPG